MISNRGRSSDRPSSRSSIVGRPGASQESGDACSPPPPGPPSSTTAFGSGGLLTLTLRGKAMDGLEEQQERTRPQLFHRALKSGRTDAAFQQRQQAGGAPSRRAPSVSLFTTNRLPTRAPGSVNPQRHVPTPPYSSPQAVQ